MAAQVTIPLAASIAEPREIILPFAAVVLVFFVKVLIEAEPKHWPPLATWAMCSDLMVAALVAYLAVLGQELATPHGANDNLLYEAIVLFGLLLAGCSYERLLGRPSRDPGGEGAKAIILGVAIPDFIGLFAAILVIVAFHG